MTRVLFPLRSTRVEGGRAVLDEARRALGPVSRAELTVGVITALTAVAWITRPLYERWVPGTSDTTIAIAGALAIFLVPVERGRAAIGWREAERLPWSVLVLFGGGLSLANAVEKTQLAAWIGGALDPLAQLPPIVLVAGVALVVLFLTELTSNTATAATFLPIAAALAAAAGIHPLLLGASAALAANCAFMLPVGTPPNAIAYATGRLTIARMARAGVWLNLLYMGLITLMVWLLAPAVFGVPRP
jgi:sodium-dependent dicarboxylate transporter 2/3/5